MSEMTSGLVERVEAATGPDRKLDGDIAEVLFLVPPFVSKRDSPEWSSWTGGRDTWTAPRFTGSIDAAMTLVLDGLYPTIDFVERRCWLRSAHGHDVFHGPAYGFAETVPLALCAAALRARAPLPAPPAKDTIV